MKKHGLDIKGKTVALSGFGNVAWGAAKKATELGAKVITISGPDGYILDEAGLDAEKIDYMLELRSSGNDICAPYADEFPGAKFFAGKKPWEAKADIYLPCATQWVAQPRLSTSSLPLVSSSLLVRLSTLVVLLLQVSR